MMQASRARLFKELKEVQRYGNCFQADPSRFYYGNQNGYQLNPNFYQFHPGVNRRYSRLGYPFRGEYSPYAVGVSWRSFGPEYRCKFCGCQQYLPPNYCGKWVWNPHVGPYSYQRNGFIDRGVGYDQSDWSWMSYKRINACDGGFDGSYVKNFGYENLPYGENSGYFQRKPKKNWGRDSNADPNVGKHGQNLGDSYNERRGVPLVNGLEEQKIAHGRHRRPQDGYRWKDDNLAENDGRDGCDHGTWFQLRNNYNHNGPGHSVRSIGMVDGRPNGENLSGFQPIFSADYTEHWNFSPDLYPYQKNIGWFLNDGGGELQGNGQPVNPKWISGKCRQTWGTYYWEHDGHPIPSSRMHRSSYGMHWNDAAARQNQQLQDVYGLHGYDQNARSQSSMDYNHNTVAENSHLDINNVRFHGHEYANSPYNENSSASEPKSTMSYTGDHSVNPTIGQLQQNSSSIPSGSGRLLQGNGPEHLSAIHERYRQNCDGNKWKNMNGYPQSYTSDYPDRSYSENKNGFQTNLTEGGSNLDARPITGGPHNAQYNSFLNNGILDGPKVKNNTVNFEYKENRDGDKWRNVLDRPQNFTVKAQPAKMTDRSGLLHQNRLTYHQAGNEATRHSQRHLGIVNTDNSEQQQPQVKSSSYMQKIYRDQRRPQVQNSEWDFLGETKPTPSPTLNAAPLDLGSQVFNCESSVENLEPEQIRGTVEELVCFTKDGKLTLAVKVLDVMEKKKEYLDPERDMSKVKMLIRACGASKAVTEAKAVHKHIVNLMSPLKFGIYNKILDMYLKCGAIADACSMFYNMAAHNLTSWDIMIKGLVKNNLGEEALDVFAEFKNTESEPDGPMFLGVFSACRLVCDVTEGMLHFESMTKHYGITASMKHYISIVEMMGHAGYLDEAMEFIEKMTVEPSVDVWETMMNVCRIQGNTELGDRCAEVVQVLDPTRLSEESKAGLIPLIASNLEKDKNETEVGLIP